MAEAVLSRRSVVKNEYQLLADITVSSATTNVDITGLNIGKDEEIVLISNVVDNNGNDTGIRIFVNGNTTITNYYRQQMYANGTSVLSVRANDSFGFGIPINNKSLCHSKIKLTNNGYVVMQHENEYNYGGSSMILEKVYTTTKFTTTSIASLRLYSQVTNAIGIGSRFQLYKVGG